jgi:hypothetical protein
LRHLGKRSGAEVTQGDATFCATTHLYRWGGAEQAPTDSIRSAIFYKTDTAGAVISAERPFTEAMMRKAAFTILGALLIAGSAVQMATASEHHMRQSHHRFDRPHNAAPPAIDSYGKPAANVTQTCDIKWCYAD